MESFLHLNFITSLTFRTIFTIPWLMKFRQFFIAIHAKFVSYHISFPGNRACTLCIFHCQPLMVSLLLCLSKFISFLLLFVFDMFITITEVWLILETLLILLRLLVLLIRGILSIVWLHQLFFIIIGLLSSSFVLGCLSFIVFGSLPSIVLVSYDIIGNALWFHILFYTLVRIS